LVALCEIPSCPSAVPLRLGVRPGIIGGHERRGY
jgi:hypothetical protein